MSSHMNNIENGFFPAWVPPEIRDFVNLSELAEPNDQLIETANDLGRQLGKNIAIYKRFEFCKSEKVPNGLCSIYQAATLDGGQLLKLQEMEQKLKDYRIVAYTNPLRKHEVS